MSNTLRRRPVELASSVSSDGPFSEHPSGPQIIPGVLTAYPGCTPRPRNLTEYRAACNAAEGDQVQEINAVNVMPGAVVWHGGHEDDDVWIGGHWMTAIGSVRDGTTVEIDLVSDTGTGTRYAFYNAAVYVRRPGTHPMH